MRHWPGKGPAILAQRGLSQRERNRLNYARFKERHPERLKLQQMKAALKSKYRVSFETYKELLKKQGGVCAVCKKPPLETKRLGLDHCHTTAAPRGLLCDGCNKGLGSFRDNVESLLRAVEYLQSGGTILKNSFVTTGGTTFLFDRSLDPESRVLTSCATSIADIMEFVDFIREERAAIERGPSVVTGYSTLLLNGGFLKIEQNATMEYGAIHFLNEMGRRVVLREGTGYRFRAESPGEGGTPTIVEVPDSGEGLPLAGDAVASRES